MQRSTCTFSAVQYRAVLDDGTSSTTQCGYHDNRLFIKINALVLKINMWAAFLSVASLRIQNVVNYYFLFLQENDSLFAVDNKFFGKIYSVGHTENSTSPRTGILSTRNALSKSGKLR